MPTEVALSTDAYRNWLRAQRPPFEWFAQLGPAEQKALADIGDEAVAEQVAVERLARSALEAALGRPTTPYHHTEPITMAGALRRQPADPAPGPTLFGKVAD